MLLPRPPPLSKPIPWLVESSVVDSRWMWKAPFVPSEPTTKGWREVCPDHGAMGDLGLPHEVAL